MPATLGRISHEDLVKDSAAAAAAAALFICTFMELLDH
jgi:hypothetical protein